MNTADLKPSHFYSFPAGSIARHMESEQVAHNIMKIRARLGDEWKLPWETYKREREKDGHFTARERTYFDRVIELIPDADGAIRFADIWKDDARRACEPVAEMWAAEKQAFAEGRTIEFRQQTNNGYWLRWEVATDPQWHTNGYTEYRIKE